MQRHDHDTGFITNEEPTRTIFEEPDRRHSPSAEPARRSRFRTHAPPMSDTERAGAVVAAFVLAIGLWAGFLAPPALSIDRFALELTAWAKHHVFNIAVTGSLLAPVTLVGWAVLRVPILYPDHSRGRGNRSTG